MKTLSEGLELFATSIMVEQGCQVAPEPRMAKDIETALGMCCKHMHLVPFLKPFKAAHQ